MPSNIQLIQASLISTCQSPSSTLSNISPRPWSPSITKESGPFWGPQLNQIAGFLLNSSVPTLQGFFHVQVDSQDLRDMNANMENGKHGRSGISHSGGPSLSKHQMHNCFCPLTCTARSDCSGEESGSGWITWTQESQLWFLSVFYASQSCVQCLCANSGGTVVKNLPANTGDLSSIPESGRSPGEGNSNPLQYSCLGNPMDRGAW